MFKKKTDFLRHAQDNSPFLFNFVIFFIFKLKFLAQLTSNL